MSQETNNGSQSSQPIDFSKIKDFQIHDGSNPPAPIETKPPVSKEDVDADGKPDTDTEGAVIDTTTKETTVKAEDTGKSADPTVEDEDEIFIEDEDFDELLSQRFDGKFKSVQDLNEKLSLLEQLEQNPTPKFPSERHQKVYEFVTKYGGDDFNAGFERYIRLQSIPDVTKLEAKDALKELYIQENPDLSKEDAELLFDDEYKRKYGDPEVDDDTTKRINQIKLNKDGNAARSKLQDLQKETVATSEDTQANDIAAKRQAFIDNAEKASKDFDRITIVPDENNPDSEFNFDFDPSEVATSLKDMSYFFNKAGWVDPQGNFDLERMKMDYALILNKEQILSTYIQHGMELGKEALLKEMENRSTSKKESNASTKVNKTQKDALKDAIMNLPG